MKSSHFDDAGKHQQEKSNFDQIAMRSETLTTPKNGQQQDTSALLGQALEDEE